MDNDNEQLDEIQEQNENRLAEKSGKQAMKKQQRKNRRKQTIKAIWQKIPLKIKLIVLLICTIAIGIILLGAIVIFLLELEEEENKAKQAYEDQLNNATRNMNLQEYLRQFSHTSEAPQSADGKFYKLYGDGVGWPTIGNADLQWKSNQYKFDCPGKVMHGATVQTVDNVKEFINSFLTRGSEAEYTNEEIDAMDIYIEKELVDSVGSTTAESNYQYVETATSGLELSQQQLFALTAIKYNFGNLPSRNGYTFKKVYEEGAGLYTINSWQHNRYIWDNWWCYLGGGSAGHIPARDAAFETYVKGIYDFSESDAGEVFSREYYIYYTQEQLNMFSYAPNKPITRTLSNEPEIFNFEEKITSSILEVCEEVMKDLIRNNVHYSLDSNELCGTGIQNASDFSRYPYCCCATYVSVVLYRSGALEENYINRYAIHSVAGVNSMLSNAGWISVSEDEVEPGDICLYEGAGAAGHVFIYAGDGYIWDQNTGCINSSGQSPSGAPLPYWESYKNNHTLIIWRMP